MVLQITVSEFAQVAAVLAQAIANVAGVDASRVSFTGFTETGTEEDARRRLLGSALQVDYSIQPPDEGPGVVNPTAVAESLTPINIQREMRQSADLASIAETVVVLSVAVDGERERQAAVKFSMILQVTASEFAEVAAAVAQTVANVAGVGVSRVTITGFTEVGSAQRRLLGNALQVDYLIQTPDAGPGAVSPTAVAESLTSSNMQREMRQSADLTSIADTLVVVSVAVDGERARQAAVKFSMVLQVTASEFAEVAAAVAQVVSNVAGVGVSRVTITGFTEVGSAQRRLLGNALQVDYLIQTPDAGPGVVSPTAVAESLTSSNMQREMRQSADLESIADTLVVVLVVVVGFTDTSTPPPPPPQDPGTTSPLVLYGAIGGASLLFLAAAVFCVCFYRNRGGVNEQHDIEYAEVQAAAPKITYTPDVLPETVDVFLGVAGPPLECCGMQSPAVAWYEHARWQQRQERQLLLPFPDHRHPPYALHWD